MTFKDKTIWITGASSGIGEALAYAGSRQGARLILSARNADQLARVQQACQDADKHYVIPLDVSATDTIPDTVNQVLAQVGTLDILINNAGVSQRSLAQDTALAVDRYLMEVNFFGTIALTKAVLPTMLAHHTGHIVTISSLMGKFGTPLRSSYAASKHALQGFMECLRAEVWEQGVRVTVICPGFINTNVSINALTADGTPYLVMDEKVANGIPVEVCAKKILAAIAKEEDEVIIAGKERLAWYIKRFMPKLFNKSIRRIKVT